MSLKQLYLGEVLDVAYVRQVVCAEANSCQKNDKDCQGPGVKLRLQQLAPGFVQQMQVSHCILCVGVVTILMHYLLDLHILLLWKSYFLY